jgi:hypothetical protein
MIKYFIWCLGMGVFLIPFNQGRDLHTEKYPEELTDFRDNMEAMGRVMAKSGWTKQEILNASERWGQLGLSLEDVKSRLGEE